jgi:hypothetical protein
MKWDGIGSSMVRHHRGRELDFFDRRLLAAALRRGAAGDEVAGGLRPCSFGLGSFGLAGLACEAAEGRVAGAFDFLGEFEPDGRVGM